MTQYQYHANNNNTGWYIISNGSEKDGDVVSTVDGKGSVPANSEITIVPDLVQAVTIANISGVAGLSVALPSGAQEGSKLIWSKDEFQWVVRRTGTGSYQITPADGADLYWFDKFGIGPVVEVKAGKNVTPPESDWTITEA